MATRDRLPRRIISGGQTGVDRAALDVAIELGIEHGGWCPRGRAAEDGVIDDRYALVETASRRPAVRTEANVRDADATLILCRGPLTGGTALTRKLAIQNAKPLLIVDALAAAPTTDVRAWIEEHAPAGVLNVAGPRESTAPGIEEWATAYLRRALA